MERKTFDIKVKEQREDGGRILISTGSLDRDKDRVRPSGALVDSYMKNPVVQWGHNYRDPWATVGKTTSLEITKNGIVADFELRPPANDQDPQHIVRLLWNGGWIKTASIGFQPQGFDENEDGGRDFNSWELLEWSLVPIPANQEALRLAVKGIVEDPEVYQYQYYRAENNSSTWQPVEIFKPYPNEHACRLRDPGEFQPNSFRRVAREHEGKEYSVIMGKLKGETTMTEQAYRYPKDNWSVAQARSHCRDHDGSEFSPASNETEAAMYLDGIIQKFSGSPRNPYGTHSSYQFKGGEDGYKRAWRLHFSQIGGGTTTGAASGPIRGTVRRIAMIAAGMKPPCQVISSDSISARTGPKSPLEGSFPEKPVDYGLDSWKKPESDADREGIRFSCSDLNIIKQAAIAEIKRRADDREESSWEPEEIAEILDIVTLDWDECPRQILRDICPDLYIGNAKVGADTIELDTDEITEDNEDDSDSSSINDVIQTEDSNELTPEEEDSLTDAIVDWLQEIAQELTGERQ